MIQVSDLSSDRRLLVLLDETGAVIRSRVLPVAMGFMASDPASGQLLAFRDTGIQEFVLYRSRWSDQK
jgi:hypothetical protein